MVLKSINRITRSIFSLGLIIILFTTSVWSPQTQADVVHRYSRGFEFDYIRWEIKALWNKVLELSFGIAPHLTIEQQKTIVQEYFTLLLDSQERENVLSTLYSYPGKKDMNKIKKLESDLALINTKRKHQSYIAEAVIQNQLSDSIASLGVPNFFTPLPPVLFQTTPLPKQLIISPRNVIRQEKSISLTSEITMEEMIVLEETIEENTDYSALVVPIGGVGTYPTMIVETTYLPSLLNTAAHEWIHNYLIFRPLGLRYNASKALRTMNETTANISGTEIMSETLSIYFPEYFWEEEIEPKSLLANNQFIPADTETEFNFSETMYKTRIRVDELLKEGKVDEAEEFMEEQRQIFIENGYQIRKLNQAYFSFYGSYADKPFSAAGKDPVGEDVRLFRAQQPDLSTFIRKMGWVLNYRQLRFKTRAF